MFGYVLALIGGMLLKSMLDGDYKDHQRNNYYQNELRQLKNEKRRKDENALSLFNARKNELITSFSNKLVEDFSNDIDFCKQEMDKEYDNYNVEINKYIDQISEIENKENLYNSRINHSLEQLAQKMGKNDINHLNILLLGPSGVGKSCLINSILKEEAAKSGMTKPTTKSFNIYESNKMPNIRLIDSRGFEKGNYDVNSFVKEITNYIESQQLKGNPDNFIHCIWYCITGTRFEDIEEETLQTLSSIYDDSKLPIIVVYTQAVIPSYYNEIKKEIEKIRTNIEYIPIIAKDIEISDNTIIKSKNIDLLLSKSLDKAKNAVYSSVFSSLRKKIKNETDYEIEQSLNNIKNKLYENINSNANDSNIIKSFNEEENYKNIFKSLLYEKNEKKELKEETKKVIKELIINLRNKNKEILGKCLNDFIQKKSYELSNKLLEIQSEVNRENDGNLKVYKSRIEFQEESKRFIYNAIVEVAKNIGFFNNIRLLPLKFVDLISNKVKKELSGIINDKSMNNVINTNIRSQFEKIFSAVKKFMF
jgi:GTP-binding protein EngB required for normal cell division